MGFGIQFNNWAVRFSGRPELTMVLLWEKAGTNCMVTGRVLVLQFTTYREPEETT